METDLTSLDRLAALERALIDKCLTRRHYAYRSLAQLPLSEAGSLLSAAFECASLRLPEIESRAHQVHEMHVTS